MMALELRTIDRLFQLCQGLNDRKCPQATDKIEAAEFSDFEILSLQCEVESTFGIRMDNRLLAVETFSQWADYIDRLVDEQRV